MSIIEKAIFTSVWDGRIHINSACKVNMQTKEVYDIEQAEDVEALEILDREFITINGTSYPVCRNGQSGFYYKM